MGMFFNSWKDDDAAYYYESINASDHYNRGYYDGRDDARKEKDGDLDKAYRKGFKAGRKKAIEELMKKLIDLFGKEVDFPHLIMQKVIEDKMIEELSYDDNARVELSTGLDDLEDPVNVDSFDDSVLEPQDSDDVVSEVTMEPNYEAKLCNKISRRDNNGI